MPFRSHRELDRGPSLAGEARPRCSVDGCPNPSSSRGWCQSHYLRWRRTGDVQTDLPIGQPRNPPTCTVEDCDGDTYARGWCGKHYKRWRRHGDPQGGRPERQPAACAVDDCKNAAESLGWCHGHYQRWLRHGHTDPGTPLDRRRQPETCTVRQCKNPTNAKGLCRTHRNRERVHGDPLEATPIRVATGEGWITHGYRGVPVPPKLRHLTNGETKALEHRLVMAQHLDRPLETDEVVHHLNGDRLDNRIENLELWTTSHPKGQRVSDKVLHALEMLARYAPHLSPKQQQAP